MLTQAMPALVKALTGVLPPAAVKQLTQALGNCNQPLSHRGDVQISPAQTPTRNGLVSGGRNGGLPRLTGWNPQQYSANLPTAGTEGSASIYEMAGFNNQNIWNQTNYGGNTFNLPLNQQFAVNNYYGSPVFNISGLMFTEGMYTPIFGAGGGEIPILNGWPMPFLPPLFGPTGIPFTPYPMPGVPGGGFGPTGPYVPPTFPAGPGPFNPPPSPPPGSPTAAPGPAGPAGAPGGTGAPGAPGSPVGVPVGMPGGFPPAMPGGPGPGTSPTGALPRIILIKEPNEKTIRYIDPDKIGNGQNAGVSVPTNAISGGTVTLKIPTDAIKGGTITLPNGIPTNAISGGTVKLDVPVNALSAGKATVPLPTNAISAVAVKYDKTSGVTGLTVNNVPRGTVTGGSITVTLKVDTATVNNVTAATLNPETCAISLTSSSVSVVTAVSVSSATFTPTTIANGNFAVGGTPSFTFTSTSASVTPTEATATPTTVDITGDLANTKTVEAALIPVDATLSKTEISLTTDPCAPTDTPYNITGTAATMGTALISLANLAAAGETAEVLIPEAKNRVQVYGP